MHLFNTVRFYLRCQVFDVDGWYNILTTAKALEEWSIVPGRLKNTSINIRCMGVNKRVSDSIAQSS